MCDIGRFDYHWIEGDDRLQRPLLREGSGTRKPVDWREALAKTADRIDAAGGTGAVRFLLSAHASLEELFLFGRLGGAFGMPEDGVAISWRVREKPQPADDEIQDSAGRRAQRSRGAATSASRSGRPPTASAGPGGVPSAGRVRDGSKALYVFDPGPDGSIGDVSWIIARARRASCRC